VRQFTLKLAVVPKESLMKTKLLLLTLVPVFLAGFFFLSAEDDPIFPIPENLQDNVTFWKMIYSQVSVKEGLIHDSQYPLVIYRTIQVGGASGRQRRRLIKQHLDEVSRVLKKMAGRPKTAWSEEEIAIASLFEKNAQPGALAGAVSRVRFQQGQKERFKDGVERSGAYLDYIYSVFDRYQVPRAIAFLPHVESSFNIAAYSHVGAAGLWQFMKRTGKLFMRVDSKIDERWDPFASTVAAAKLLKKNYDNLQAWPLAITAYNHGPESIARAVKLTGSRDLGVIIDQYQNRRFKFASKNFYSCFLAASAIATDAGLYFTDLQYHKPWQYNEIQLEGAITPLALGQRLGLSTRQIASLNPALRPVLSHRGLAIPQGYLLRLPAEIPGELAREKLKKNGYKASVPEDLEPVAPVPATKPKTGPIPAPVKEKPDLKDNRFGRDFDPSLYNLGTRLVPAENAFSITVSVDETLGHYADWLGISSQDIREINDLNRRSIRINQRLLLPLADARWLETFQEKRRAFHLSLEEAFYRQYLVIDVRQIKIRYGENPWSLCNDEGNVPLWLFTKFNRHLDMGNIKVHTLVWLPVVRERTDQGQPPDLP